MSIQFNYQNETVEKPLTAKDLLEWIGRLHTEMTNNGLLPDRVSVPRACGIMAFLTGLSIGENSRDEDHMAKGVDLHLSMMQIAARMAFERKQRERK